MWIWAEDRRQDDVWLELAIIVRVRASFEPLPCRRKIN